MISPLKRTTILASLFVITLISVSRAASPMRCTDEELDEAQKSFRNCVDSAKAGIVSRHAGADEDSEDDASKQIEKRDGDYPEELCKELDMMLDVCEKEVSALSFCKGRDHVENLKAIHLSSIADVLKALNDNLMVNNCPVFHSQFNGPEYETEFNSEDSENESFANVSFEEKEYQRYQDAINSAGSTWLSGLLFSLLLVLLL